MTVVLFDTEDSITALVEYKLHQQKWMGQVLELLVLIEQEALSKKADFIKLLDGTRQHMLWRKKVEVLLLCKRIAPQGRLNDMHGNTSKATSDSRNGGIISTTAA